MKFASLKEMLELRGLCPLCKRPMNFGFQVVNGKAFVKYSQRTTDILMNIDIERNWVSCNQLNRTYRDAGTAWDRPSFRNLTKPDAGALSARCTNRVTFIDGEPSKFNEYSYSYDIVLNRMKNRVEEITVGIETYKILDGYSQYELQIRHGSNEVNVTKIAMPPDRNIYEKLPITYFSNMTTPTRESLLRKIKTIRIMKDS